MTRNLVLVCRWMFVVLMGIAGISKLSSLASFRDSLDSWVLLPEMTRAPITLLVPMAEVLLVLVYIFYRYRSAYFALGSVVVLFTVVFLLHVVLVEPPDCSCTAKLLTFQSWHDSVLGIVLRNAVYILIWAIGIIGLRHEERHAIGAEVETQTV